MRQEEIQEIIDDLKEALVSYKNDCQDGIIKKDDLIIAKFKEEIEGLMNELKEC